jgi:hypothetical protein
VEEHSTCSIGDRCHSYIRSIGFTLDDILREEIQVNVTLKNQSFLVKMSAVLTTAMFLGGLINSVLSLLTFQNKELRRVGCGMYLFASSITSLLTISMLTVKYWFVVLTQINTFVPLGGCIIIEPLLKLFVYLDAWLNACVAVERTVAVSKGINFDQKKSKRVARWIILILPFCIMGTIIHEPIYRDLFKYQIEIYKPQEYEDWANKSQEHEISTNKSNKYEIQTHVWCVTYYSRFVQHYNTFILFFHFISPFVANLFSALFIIFGVARQRSVTQTKKSYIEHVREQSQEHKQLIISPIILLILALPRLIISLLSECMKTSNNPWLYLSAYFISFTPSMLVFVVFVVPSHLYMKTFKESITKRWQ